MSPEPVDYLLRAEDEDAVVDVDTEQELDVSNAPISIKAQNAASCYSPQPKGCWARWKLVLTKLNRVSISTMHESSATYTHQVALPERHHFLQLLQTVRYQCASQ